VKLPFKRGDVLEQVRVEDLTTEGHGIARVDRAVLFIEGAAPGDLVNVQVYRTKKNYGEAKIVELLETSADRTTPRCAHFGTCGGCKLQHIVYERQLAFKQKLVTDAFERIGKVEFPELLPILGSAEVFAYRNRLDYAAADRRWLTAEEIASGEPISSPGLGFHIPGRFDKILDITTCHLQDNRSNTIRNSIKEYAVKHGLEFFNPVSQEGFLRNVIVRSTSTGEWMVIIVFKKEQEKERIGLLEHVRDSFPEITSLLYIINEKRNDTIFDQDVVCFSGRDHILEEMEGLTFKISAKSFYQTNSHQAYALYRITRDFAGLTGAENVYDLYTGTGTIAQFVAKAAKHVAGIDYVDDAIADAGINAANNKIDNVAFVAGDLKDAFNNDFIAKNGLPDVIITDPPRSGMHPDVVQKILELKPVRIVYVSCNPTTQARDIQLLSTDYRIEKIQPVDMFPHTTHVENVVLLQRIV
jgi:23S rRNA (uracil1939-C5)-methyltransferase